jgi:hypothetical protein
MTMLEKMARAICKSRTGYGASCCEWPANMGVRHVCAVKTGNFDEAAKAALQSLLQPDEGTVEAMAKHEWSGGYDRDGSHAAGAYVEYVDGLEHMTSETNARVIASEVFTAAIEHMLKGAE